MKTLSRFLPIGAFLLLLVALPSCGKSKSDAVEAREAAGTVNGLCPVREEPVVEGNFLDQDGQKIGFCCPPCKADFLKKPETYLAKMRADRERFGYVGK